MHGLTCAYADNALPYERHFHNAYELLYVLSGKIEIAIDDKVYTVHPHSLVFISKLEEHSVRVLESPYQRYYLLISPEKLLSLIPHPALRSVFINRPDGFCHVFPLKHTTMTDTIWPHLVQDVTAQPEFTEWSLSSLLTEMLICCYREHTERFTALYQPVNPAIYEIRAYLEQHFDEPISLSDLAEQYYLSPGYMTHTFTEAVGCSPKRYIMLNRIAKAKELLLRTKTPVLDIGVQCGFNDANNFTRFFKQETGYTPRQYRDGNRDAVTSAD